MSTSLTSSRQNSASSRKLSLLLLTTNLIGTVVYLLGVRHSWAIPKERAAGIYSVTGEPFVWAAYGFPVLALFALINIGWIIDAFRRRQWSEGYWLSSAALLWLIALWIDFAHH